MLDKRKSQKPAGRGERHSAAWGKRLTATLLLLTGLSFGQNANAAKGGRGSNVAPDVAQWMNAAATRPNQQVSVIVQYKGGLNTAAVTRVQGLGGHVYGRLDLIKAGTFTVPARSLATLANDPEVAFVSLNHSVQVADDLTNGATGWLPPGMPVTRARALALP
jgi:hypothetical protein